MTNPKYTALKVSCVFPGPDIFTSQQKQFANVDEAKNFIVNSGYAKGKEVWIIVKNSDHHQADFIEIIGI